MDILHIKQLLYYRKHSLCALELHDRSFRRATGICISHSLTNLCVRTLQAHTYMYITLWCATAHDNKTHVHVAYGCYYTPNDGFTANNLSFYKSEVGQLH